MERERKTMETVRRSMVRAALCTAALLGALGISAAVAPQVMADAAQQPEAAQAQGAQQQQQEAARPDADVQGILAAVRGGLVLDGLDVSVPEGTDVQITVQGGGVWVYQAAPGAEDAEATAEVPSSQEADPDASTEAPAPSDVVEPIADLAQDLSSDPPAAPDAEPQPQAPTWVEGAEGEPGSWDTHGVAAKEAALASLSGGAYALQADGTGTGAARGFRGEVSVIATVAAGQVSLSATLPEGEEMDAEQAQSYLDALAQGGEVDAVSGATVTCRALRDAAASALVAATEGLEPSAAGDEAAWSATPLEEATKRAAALAEALDGRSVVAEDGTKAPAESVTWVVVGQDSAPDAAVAWQPAVRPASGDAHDLLVEDGTGAKGWWSAPADQQPALDQPAADPGQTVTPPAGDTQQPEEGADPETPPAEGGEGQQPDQPSDPGQDSEEDGSEGAGDDQQPDAGEDSPVAPPSDGDEGSDDAEQQPDGGDEGDLPAEGGEDPTMPDGTPVEDTPSIDVDPTDPADPGEDGQPDEGTGEPADPETPPADGGEGQQPDQPADPGQGQQPSDPVDPPQEGGEATVPESPGSGETGGETGGDAQPEKVWVVDQEAYDEQVWVETKPAWDEELWVVDVPASTTEQWVVDQAAWDEQVWVPNQVWIETSPAWDEPVYGEVSICSTCGNIIQGDPNQHLLDTGHSSWYSDYVQTGTIHHDAQGYYEDQGYWTTVHHEEVGHMETVTVPEQGHTEVVHHEAEGYWETVHHEEVGHWEWR